MGYWLFNAVLLNEGIVHEYIKACAYHSHNILQTCSGRKSLHAAPLYITGNIEKEKR